MNTTNAQREQEKHYAIETNEVLRSNSKFLLSSFKVLYHY